MTDNDNKDDHCNDAEYEVGYKKPPRHRQFQKGQSGNPNGRPKGTRNFKTDVQALLRTPVRLNKNGRAETVSTQQGMLLRLGDSALKGDVRALQRLLALAAMYNDDEFVNNAVALPNAVDETILKNYFNRHYSTGRMDEHLVECVENEMESIDDHPDSTQENDEAID